MVKLSVLLIGMKIIHKLFFYHLSVSIFIFFTSFIFIRYTTYSLYYILYVCGHVHDKVVYLFSLGLCSAAHEP